MVFTYLVRRIPFVEHSVDSWGIISPPRGGIRFCNSLSMSFYKFIKNKWILLGPMSDILHTEEQELHHNCCRYIECPNQPRWIGEWRKTNKCYSLGKVPYVVGTALLQRKFTRMLSMELKPVDEYTQTAKLLAIFGTSDPLSEGKRNDSMGYSWKENRKPGLITAVKVLSFTARNGISHTMAFLWSQIRATAFTEREVLSSPWDCQIER